MAKWVKEVKLSEADLDKAYFIAKRFGISDNSYSFYSRGKNGKTTWSSKPGIACHCVIDEKLHAAFNRDPKLILVEIPDDHAKRWTRR